MNRSAEGRIARTNGVVDRTARSQTFPAAPTLSENLGCTLNTAALHFGTKVVWGEQTFPDHTLLQLLEAATAEWGDADSPVHARLLARLAEALRFSPEPERREAVFRHEGNYWTIEYAGTIARLKDSKGVQYLAHLLRHPGQEFLALDLMIQVSGARDQVSGSMAPKPETGHVGPMLDAQAKAEYRTRLRELREELEDARAMNDLGRAERAQAELEFITQEVAAAVGLGGRDRPSGSDVERARQTVTKGIKSAIANLRSANPAAGRHFARAIRTGYYCAYVPDPDDCPTWVF